MNGAAPTNTVATGARSRAANARVLAAVGGGFLLVDQLTKAWALEALDDRNIDLFWKLRFNLVFNSGMAFSKGGGLGPVLGIAALVISGVIISIGLQSKSLVHAIALGMIAGGALGNLLDRLFRSSDGFLKGRVIDFIDAQFWPVFNVADIGVTCGVILLLIVTAREKPPAATAES